MATSCRGMTGIDSVRRWVQRGFVGRPNIYIYICIHMCIYIRSPSTGGIPTPPQDPLRASLPLARCTRKERVSPRGTVLGVDGPLSAPMIASSAEPADLPGSLNCMRKRQIAGLRTTCVRGSVLLIRTSGSLDSVRTNKS